MTHILIPLYAEMIIYVAIGLIAGTALAVLLTMRP